MWILESRGDFFQGRRMWLKPGKQYLFGRVKKDGVRFALDNKTVSRKHFVINVDNVKETDVGTTQARTTVTITDQGSKTGTTVNGESAKLPRTLIRTENVIKLGVCQEELLVKWEPVVLTFNLLKKEVKSGLLKAKQERIKDLDVKAISDFLPGISTMLVVSKRNTARGLQALIDGKALVDESYIDALEYAATPTDLDEEENLSPLEIDFDSAWPNVADYLPPPGKEPTQRPPQAYRPDAARSSIFEGFTFVFGDQTQYDNLLPPITTGHGKAVLFPIKNGETTPDELVQFMRVAAGKRSFGDKQRDVDAGGVIMVRWTTKEHSRWTNDLINQVALKLDQRAIEQSEFLDAVLANDALSLRQTVPYERNPDDQTVPSSTTVALASLDDNETGKEVRMEIRPSPRRSQPSEVSSSKQSAIGKMPSRAFHEPYNGLETENSVITTSSQTKPFRFSPPIKSQYTDFDDDFNENAIIPFEEDVNDEELEQDESVHSPENTSAKALQPVQADSDDQNSVHRQLYDSRKRPRPVSQESREAPDNGDGLDAMLPGISSMKRRKLIQARPTQQDQVKVKKAGIVLPVPTRRSMKEVDVKEELRTKREEDKKRALQGVIDNEDQQPIEYDENGNLPIFDVVTDYFDVPTRKKPGHEVNGLVSDRWDPRWNGRKNFKAFRRARDNVNGAPSTRRRAHTRIIVPLVDAKQVTYGLGDQYWERTEEDKEKDRERRARASQRTTQSQANSSNRPGSTHMARHPEHVEAADEPDIGETPSEVIRLQKEAAEILDDKIDIEEPRHTSVDDHQHQRSFDTAQSVSQLQSSALRSARQANKRPASGARDRTDKRQKTLLVNTSYGGGSDSEDSDEMKFKFGKGRRGRGLGRGLGR